MTIRSILVPSSHKLDLAHALDAGLTVAKPLDAHLSVIHVSPSENLIGEDLRQFGLDLVDVSRRLRDASQASNEIFTEWCAAHHLAHRPEHHLLGSTFARWTEIEGDLEAVIARTGRLSDLIIVNRPIAASPQTSRCFDAAVFAAGRPTLVAPPQPFEQPLRHVLIAWNGSLEAMHSVAMCLDLIHAAEEVSIFSATSERGLGDIAGELASALRWHGIEAKCPPLKGGHDLPVAAALLQTAKHVNASLIIMGGYTHSRVRETLLGGVTHHMLAQADLPVIMTH